MDARSVIERLGGGHFMDALEEAMLRVSEDVLRTGNPGAVTVTLKITQAQPDEPAVIVQEAIKRTMPSQKPRGAIYYAHEGSLHAKDPRQVEMEFRVVDQATGEIKKTTKTATVREVNS